MDEADRDQGNGPDQCKLTREESYLGSVVQAARTRLELVHLERTLAALQAQLLQEEAASADLLRELRGAPKASPEEVRVHRPELIPWPHGPNFRAATGG